MGAKIGQGKARYIKDATQLDEFQKGEVLVTEITDPDWEPIMKIASAIVTNSGGRTRHAAIVSRANSAFRPLWARGNATEVLKTGMEITVSCAEGEAGQSLRGPVKV